MNKFAALFRSRRFWATVAGSAVVASGDTLGMDQAQSTTLAGLIGVWVLGDSVNKT